MLNSSAPICGLSADAAFGPVVDDGCRDGFDFTIVFEQSVFVIVPAVLLLLAGPIRLRQLYKSRVHVSSSTPRVAKLIVTACLACLQLSLVALWATRGSPSSRLNMISLAAACVSFLSSLMLCALSYTEHTKSPRPSSLLNSFLLVSLFLDCALVRTVWLSDIITSIKGVVTTAVGVKAVLVLLEAMGKKKHLVDPPSSYTPEQTAGLYARALLAWVAPLLRTGFQRLLQPGDLFKLDDDMTASTLHEKFAHTWAHSFKSSKHRLVLCCISCLRTSLVAVIIPRIFLLAFTICQPLIVSSLLNFLNDLAIPVRVGYGLIGAYGFVYLGIALSQALYWHRNARSVSMLRGALVTAVYSKLTDLGADVASDAAAVTLMSSDVDVIVRAMKEIHEFWANTLQIAIGTWLLSKQIGFAAVGPIIVCLVTLLCTVLTSPRAKASRVVWLKKTQERVAITSAMIGQIKGIRMSGLSQTLSGTISRLRLEEVVASRPFRVIGSITSSLAQIPIFISPVVAFALFQGVAAQSGLALNATRLFAALALITLQAQPLFFMFEVILDLSAASGAVDRIQKFLLQPSSGFTGESLQPRKTTQGEDIELQPLTGLSLPLERNSAQGIKLENASFSWSEAKTNVSKVNLEVTRGQLAMITGPVASGKSTLLKGILNEVPHTAGRVQVAKAKRSWCQQSPWIINGTVQENITGYSLFHQPLYEEIIHACALDEDFAQLPAGDQTRVGSKGFTLSGGQKQRVAIARAAYSQPEVAVFDDVFSGLDNNTAQRIFANLFGRNGLFRKWNTTTVLATQSVGFFSSADVILVLNRDGTSRESGSFTELSKSNGYIQTLQSSTPGTLTQRSDEPEKTDTPRPVPKSTLPTRPVEQDKRRQLGDASVYRYYFGSIGAPFALTLLALEIIWAFLQSFPSVWLKFWSDAESKHHDQVGYYLGIYAALQVVGVIWFAILIWFVLVRIAARSGITLHQRLLNTVLKAPLSLFAKSDLGSTTTRFSQDIGMVDNQLPLALVVTLASFFTVFAKAGLLAASSYYVAICFPFLGVLYYFLQKGYLRTSRQLRFLDLEEKAPVYTQFLETLDGLSTIRAFGWSQAAIRKNHELVDKSQKPFYLLIMVQRWLVLILDLATAALALLVVGVSVHLRGSVSVSLTGVSLVQLISMSETLNLLIQFWTSIETSIGAVARIKQFAEDTSEESLPGESTEPPANWPGHGHITISNVSATYGEDNDCKALDDLCMDILPGEKVGICGRTGSGKSSLLLTLLRMLDHNRGSITIDSIGLETLPRETIRSRLIAISQDQFILPGTVRENIDPFHSHQAETVTQALKDVGLWESIDSKGGLDTPMKEDMLSHGQKQLFFLGRALLRKDVGKIVLLDEATSSIDVETEQSVKRIIEDRFQEHTIIAVAHRLETVMDFDRVFVLEQGKIVEVGNPRELLESKGYFKTLWDASHGSSA